MSTRKPSMPDNHQHDEVLEKILTHFDVDMCAAYAIDDGLSEVNRLDSHDAIMEARAKALTALRSYVENEKWEARHDEVQAANLVPLEDLPGYIANRVYELRAALRATQDSGDAI